MNTQVIKYLQDQERYYNERSEDPVYRAIRDIINSFRNVQTGEFEIDTLKYGHFRSIEENLVRHPESYRKLTSVDLTEDLGQDFEVAKHLVILFREVGNINRNNK